MTVKASRRRTALTIPAAVAAEAMHRQTTVLLISLFHPELVRGGAQQVALLGRWPWPACRTAGSVCREREMLGVHWSVSWWSPSAVTGLDE